MKLFLGAIGVLLLLALLTWLLLRGVDTNAAGYAQTLLAFDDFALAEASFDRDILQARAGLLPNYDSLGRTSEAMEDAVARLRSQALTEGLDAGPVDRLAATVAQREGLAEEFKRNNALRRNSLTYVGLLSTSPTFGAQDPQLAAASGALAAAILHLTMRYELPGSAEALQKSIDRFAAQAPAVGQDAEPARALLAHARLLREVLPAVDQSLQALLAVPSGPPLEDARLLFSAHRSAMEATAQRYRLLLYLVSLLLVVMLVGLGLKLRARALALRRRAAFEHVIAENSTRLINCPPSETGARLRQVLGELCRAIGAERAYVVLDENPTRIYAWSPEDGTPHPPGWPGQALAVSARLGAARPGIITVPDVGALPPGEDKDTLLTAGVRSWACAPLSRPGRERGIMGFDIFRPARDQVFPAPVLRLASDAVANAIEREALDRDRARLATRLERARRMQMIGSLASGIAHNFNNIIGAILGYTEMLEPLLQPGTQPVRHIDEIRRAAERGRDLIENILSFGRRRDARVRPVQVRTLFEEAASLLRASLPENVELIVADVPADVAVSGEPAQLQQIILNLSTNAAQAMTGNGQIRVTAERKDVGAPLALSHGELRPGRYVCLAVSDTGRGFDNGLARRLFEPFFTTRSEGTGLGLATVHEIVRDHEGAMNVQSKRGHGSRFEAWLPAAAADSSAALVPAVLPLGRGETVLVVESEEERLLRDEEMLAALGYEPVGFEDPTDAVAAWRAAPDRFDAVVISHAAGTPDGLQLARRLHDMGLRQPILLATGSTIDVTADALTEAGIAELLCGPLVSTELAAALARCLRSPRPLQM